MSNGSKAMIVVGGSKGGVGKSLVSMAVVDWLHCAMRMGVLLVETDNSNSDVHKAYATELKPAPTTANLDVRDGWLTLADRCAEHPDAHVVINTGARNVETMLRYAGPIMTSVATELQRHIAVLWVIDEKRDCIELLRRYIDETPDAVRNASRLHVVCNEGKVERQSFQLYLQSETAKMVDETIVFPNLAQRATTLLYDERRSIRVVAEGDAENPVPFGTRIEMSRWRNLVWERLEPLGLAEG